MPFAGYKDFADCVAKNKGKVRDPEAYCATIQRQAEGKEDKGEAKETPPRSTEHTGWWKGHL